MPDEQRRPGIGRAWPGARRGRNAAGGQEYGPPAPPPWATSSLIEDGGVTHEHVSAVHPLVLGDHRPEAEAGVPRWTSVSVSVVDRQDGQQWNRMQPTVQIEGGRYSLDDARLLAYAIGELLSRVG